MPATFSGSEKDAPSSVTSSYDSAYGRSEDETVSQASNDEDDKRELSLRDRDWACGRQCLSWLMLQSLQSSKPAGTCWPQIEVERDQALSKLPYGKMLDDIKRLAYRLHHPLPLHSWDSGEPQFPLLTYVGQIIREGDEDLKDSLFSIIKHGFPSVFVLPDRTGEARRNSPVAEAKGQYAKLLNEYAARKGLECLFGPAERIGTTPSFKAYVTFDGVGIPGIGRNSADAKHEAAKEACRRHDIAR